MVIPLNVSGVCNSRKTIKENGLKLIHRVIMNLWIEEYFIGNCIVQLVLITVKSFGIN